MTKLLQDAIEHLKTRPETEQDAIAADMIDRIADYSDVRLSAEQEAEVARRIREPANHASMLSIREFFARFGIEA